MNTIIMGWAAECEEWIRIRDELNQDFKDAKKKYGNDLKRAGPLTAFDVTLEQRKRMLARGQRPMTYEEIVHEFEAECRPGLTPESGIILK